MSCRGAHSRWWGGLAGTGPVSGQQVLASPAQALPQVVSVSGERSGGRGSAGLLKAIDPEWIVGPTLEQK